MEGVPGVSTISELAHVSHIQRKCQDMCGWKGYLLIQFLEHLFIIEFMCS
ncbi:UNVERIFIED_CONTAM: hypothetical protein NCL1_29917 [Trichonephila clavipes]